MLYMYIPYLELWIQIYNKDYLAEVGELKNTKMQQVKKYASDKPVLKKLTLSLCTRWAKNTNM